MIIEAYLLPSQHYAHKPYKQHHEIYCLRVLIRVNGKLNITLWPSF